MSRSSKKKEFASFYGISTLAGLYNAEFFPKQLNSSM